MNKKSIIIVGVLFGILIIGLIIYLVLSLTTDIFKPASEIFERYYKQNIVEINKITDFSKEQDYVKLLTEDNYRDSINIDLKYTNSEGNLENFIITSNGIINNPENNSNRKIDIKYGDNINIMNLEYLHENQTYGLLFSNVVKQFVSANIDNFENLLEIINIDANEVKKYNLSEIYDLIINKKENIENICDAFIKNMNHGRFKKQKSVQVVLNNGEEKVANTYTLNLSKEETKELYLEILKELGKQEEITEINTTKRQFSETEVVIYIAENKTIRVSIEVENKQIKIDFYDNELNIKYNNITPEEIITKNIDFKREEQNVNMDYSDSYNNKVKIDYSLGEDISKKNAQIQLNIKNDYIKDISIVVNQSVETSNSKIEGIQKTFENQSNINISALQNGNRSIVLNGLLKRIDLVLRSKNNQLNSEILNLWLNYNKKLEDTFQGIKEKKKNEFNNLFLIYKGEDVEKEIIYNLLDLAGRNMKKYEKIGEDSYKVFLSEGTQNSNLAEEMKSVIENSDKKFNIDFGFDSDGKINLINIRGMEKK